MRKKKWGSIGAPKSAKRKRHMKKIAKQINRKYKGYGSKKSFVADRRKRAKHKPAKRYRKGIGNRGDWRK